MLDILNELRAEGRKQLTVLLLGKQARLASSSLGDRGPGMATTNGCVPLH